MSDTFNIRITASETASPAFRSIAAEAKKADSVLDSMGSGASKSLQQIEQSSDEAAASVKKFGTATKDAESSTKGFGDGLTKIGAGAGVAISALSLLGQASVSQQQSIASLQRSYGSAADEILAFTERIQDSTRFSNDSARDAASLAATLANQYGLSTSQIEVLLTRTADLAQQFGISFEDAATRTTSAIRGEAESAEYLNLSLSQSVVAAYAASLGYDNFNTTMSQSQQAQIRLQLLLEQSAASQGAAGEAAETAAGRTTQLVNSLQDAAQSAGGFLGPAAGVASVLGDMALLGVPVGAGLGKIASGALAAGQALAGLRVGGLAVGAALGPIGLAAAAIGITALAIKKVGDSADEAREASEGLAAALAGAASSTAFPPETFTNIASGISDALSLEFESINSNNSNGGFSLAGLADSAVSSLVNAFADNPELKELTQQLTDIVTYAFTSGAPNAGLVADELFNLNTALHTHAIELPEYRERVEELSGELASFGVITIDTAGNVVILGQSTEAAAASLVDFAAAGETVNSTLKALTSQADFYGVSLLSLIDGQIALLEAQAQQQLVTLDPGLAQTQLDILNLETAAVPLRRKAAEENAESARGLGEAVSESAQTQIDAEREANRAILDAYAERKQASIEAAAEARDARAESAASVAESYRSALGQSSDAPLLDGLADMVAVGDLTQEQADRITAAFDGMTASGASTLDMVVGLADAMGYAGTETFGFAAGLYDAVDATNGVLGLYDAIDNLGAVLSKANGIANDLFGPDGNPYDGIGPLVDLLNNGIISQEQFNDATEAGIQIQADNTRGQEALNAVRANMLPLLADQTDQLADYYETLGQGDAALQQQALYLGDAANQTKVLGIEQAIYAASIGEIPEVAATKIVVDAAQADPVLRQFLLDTGQISEDPITGEITVNYPQSESLPMAITTLNDSLQDLIAVLEDLAGVDDPFGPLADKAKLLAGVDFDNLNGLGPKVKGLGGAAAAFNGGKNRPGDGIDGYNPIIQGDPAAFPPTGQHYGGIGGFIPGYRPEHGVTNTTQPGQFPYSPSNPPPSVPATPLPQGSTEDRIISTRMIAIDEATPVIEAADAVRASKDGAVATLFALGDNGDAVSSIGAAAAAFGNEDGSVSTLFAKGDNADALSRIGEAASSLAGVDGTQANLFVKGIDNYSGIIGAARSLGGAVLATTFVDTYHRDFFNTFGGKANGGVLGFADGGVLPSAALGRVLVGENGPEIATLPGGTLITPSPASQAIARTMLGEGGGNGQQIVVNNYGTIAGIEDMAGFIFDAMQQANEMQTASMGGL